MLAGQSPGPPTAPAEAVQRLLLLLRNGHGSSSVLPPPNQNVLPVLPVYFLLRSDPCDRPTRHQWHPKAHCWLCYHKRHPEEPDQDLSHLSEVMAFLIASTTSERSRSSCLSQLHCGNKLGSTFCAMSLLSHGQSC